MSAGRQRGDARTPALGHGPPLAAVAVLFAVALVRVAAIVPSDPSGLVVDEPPAEADAIVLFEGGLERIPRAAELLAAGFSSTIIYPGLAPVARPYLDRALAAIDRPVRVLAPPRTVPTTSTWEEACAVRSILREQDEIRSIMLVTSRFHSRRARLTLEAILPPSVAITSVSPPRPSWSPMAAGSRGPARELYQSERLKLAAYSLRLLLQPPGTRCSCR